MIACSPPISTVIPVTIAPQTGIRGSPLPGDEQNPDVGWVLQAGWGWGRMPGQFDGTLLCREQPPNPPAARAGGAGDLVVVNNTRVFPARVFARKLPGGGKVEILLLHREDPTTWEALVGGKGLTVGRQIAEMAQRRGIDCVPHAWLTDLLKAASLHLNAYLMHSLYLEFNVSSASLLNHLCTRRLEMKDGCIAVPDGPGLGVEVDPKAVEKYRVL